MKKKIIATCIAGLMACGLALATGLNTYDGNTYTTLLEQDLVTATSVTGTVVDVGPYKGIATVIINVSDPVANAGTNTVTIQHATASGGTYSTLTNEAGTAMTKSVATTGVGTNIALKLDLAVAHRYIRAVGTCSDTTGVVSAHIVLPPR